MYNVINLAYPLIKKGVVYIYAAVIQKYWRTFFDIGLIVLTVYLIMFSFSKLYQLAAPVFLSFLYFY